MKEKVSHDLNDFLDQTYSELTTEYERLRKRTIDDPGTAGDQGEENWKKLLEKWIPSYFKIAIKGRLINEHGDVSPQVDLLILRPEYPEFLMSKKLYLTGGVLAAFEVKTTFKIGHLKKFFDTCIGIKKSTYRNYSVPPTPYSDLQKPLLFGILAHSHNLKKEKTESRRKLVAKVIELDKQLITHPSLMPDLICISNLLTISAQKIVEIENGCPLASYISFPQLGNNKMITEERIPLAALLTQLFKKISYQYNNLQPIANYFSLSGIQKAGAGTGRRYSREIYSKEVQELLKHKLLIPYKESSEWVTID